MNMGVLVVAAVGAALLVWQWCARPARRRAILTLVAVAGLSFQVLHIAEHVVQSAVWVAAPDRPPFLTPWATWGAEALAVTGHASLGQELLHLVGNAVFLLGLLALVARVRPSARAVRLAVAWQGAHLLEHVALSLTTAVWGRAIGVTTLLGTLEAGPTLWRLRVLAHLALNTIASIYAAVGIVHTVRASTTRSPKDPSDGDDRGQVPETRARARARSTAV